MARIYIKSSEVCFHKRKIIAMKQIHNNGAIRCSSIFKGLTLTRSISTWTHKNTLVHNIAQVKNKKVKQITSDNISMRGGIIAMIL